MEKLNIYGQILGSTGYSSHTRQLVNALLKLNKEGIAMEFPKFPDWEKQCNDAELELGKKLLFNDAHSLVVALPNQWGFYLNNSDKKFLGYVVWEGDKVPRFWYDYLIDERVMYILVPSNHTKQAIMNTFNDKNILDKIVVVPHGVDTSTFFPLEKEKKETFRFVANKGWSQGLNDRGGVQWLLKAFNEEFSINEPVELFVKINTAYCGPGWNLDVELSKLDLKPNGGKINLTLETVPFGVLNSFYNQCDVFVSPNMGESFGLPIAEAMGSGLPVIVTGFGGQTDFVTDGKEGFLIDYDLVENNWDVMYEGVKWAKPDLKHLKKLLRFAYNNPEKMREMGLNARKRALEMGWEKSAQLILDLLKT